MDKLKVGSGWKVKGSPYTSPGGGDHDFQGNPSDLSIRLTNAPLMVALEEKLGGHQSYQLHPLGTQDIYGKFHGNKLRDMMTYQAEVQYWLQIGPTQDLGNCDSDMKLKPAFTFKLVSPFFLLWECMLWEMSVHTNNTAKEEVWMGPLRQSEKLVVWEACEGLC